MQRIAWDANAGANGEDPSLFEHNRMCLLFFLGLPSLPLHYFYYKTIILYC